MPRAELPALVTPYYSKGETRRKPVGPEIMLRVYLLQQGFALSDLASENAMFESAVLPRFACVDLGRALTPDEATIFKFRHLLEEHRLCGQMLDAVNHCLESHGIRIATGTIVDATIIHVPSSTKNEKKDRDPAMNQTRKGNQWNFGMKSHTGVDSKGGVLHSVCASAASVRDKHMLADLIFRPRKEISSAKRLHRFSTLKSRA